MVPLVCPATPAAYPSPPANRPDRSSPRPPSSPLPSNRISSPTFCIPPVRVSANIFRVQPARDRHDPDFAQLPPSLQYQFHPPVARSALDRVVGVDRLRC